MSDRKESGVAFWATVVVVVVLVAYPLSFGPACWITSRAGRGVEHVPFIFGPVLSCWQTTPILVQKAIRSYALVGSAEGWEWERINGTRWHWVKYRRSDAEWMEWDIRKRNEYHERLLKAAEREEPPAPGPIHLIRDYGLREEPD